MPQFRYRAVTAAGEVITGEVDAPSRAEVIRRMEHLGHLPVDAEIATKGLLVRGGGIFGGSTPRPREVTVFLRQLALLISAGLTLEAALQTLGEDAGKSLALFANNLRSEISTGTSFAEALEHHPSIIEPIYVAMLRAGETAGKLAPVLQAIVEDRSRKEQLAERISSAVRYPLFLITTSVLILLFFLIYVIPQFQPVFKDLGGRLNPGAAFVLATSVWLQENFDLFAGICLAVVLSAWLILTRPAWKARIFAALTSIPGIAGPMRDRRTARIIGTLGLLIENGVPLSFALKILRDVVSEPRSVASLERLYDQVRTGGRFADALADSDLLPPLAVRMLRVGDETGDLPSVAAHVARFYEQKVGTGLDRLMGAVGPVTIVLVSGFIGALILSIMSALLSITDLAQ